MTLPTIQARVERFIGRINNNLFSRVQAQSWLDALQCMDENQQERLGAVLLIENLHMNALEYVDEHNNVVRPYDPTGLWKSPDSRRLIRIALCESYLLPAARLL
jgi:hypothetical protein